MKGFCIDCRFWEPDGDEGLCHRHAPRPLEENAEAYFPSTCRGDWCGDFQLKGQEVEQ